MQGFVIERWGSDPRWSEIDEPRPGPGDVLVLVEACGVGLTVINCINGDLASDPDLLPRVPGHELVGRVVELGEGVDPALLGRRVVAYFYLFCGQCHWCRSGREQRCDNLAGWVGVHRDGGYAPLTVLPERQLVPIPDGVDPVAATVIADAVATPVHVAGVAGIGPDDRVVVIGAGGGVGIHMVQVARHAGAEVVGLDVGDAKAAVIERFGARPVESGTDLDPHLFGGTRPTVVVDFVGTAATAAWAVTALDAGGRMVALTTFPGRPATFQHRDLVFREISLLGSRYATRAEVVEAAGLVADGHVTPVIGAVAPPADVLGIHDELRDGTLIGRGALDWSNA
ncbi:MAG: alcohol dehydrogenase catalytic domain-containing protein [Acidimicrobiia bacterium]